MAKTKQQPKYNVRNTVYGIVNDSYLKLDGDPTEVKDGTTQYETGIRLLRSVVNHVLNYRRWSFMRDVIHGKQGENCICDFVKVLRVYDSNNYGLRQVYHTNHLNDYEYYIWGNKLVTGRLHFGCKDIFIEVQYDDIDITNPETVVDERLFDILVLGLCTELCKVDQGSFRAIAGDREKEYQDKLDTMAKQDMNTAGDSILYDAPPSMYRGGRIIL